MRLTAYKDSLEETKKLPVDLVRFNTYFSCMYSPRHTAMDHIMKKARFDDGLLHCEFVELHGFYNIIRLEP